MRAVVIILSSILLTAAVQAGPPNILIILADDMGYGDLSCTGTTTIQTPRLDGLAASGILCTQAHVASSVCSPSRAGLITGRDPRRFGYEGNLDHLAAAKQSDKTLVVFFSDNGGATTNASWNGPLSGAKGSLREGGVRVPMIWSWPGTLPAGGKFDAPASSLNLLPTFLAAAGADPLPLAAPRAHEDKGNRKRATQLFGAYDGINLLPALADPSTARPRTLFWRLQGQRAVLHGDDKLINLLHRPALGVLPALVR